MSFGTEKDLGTASKLTEFVVGQQQLTRPIWKPYGIVVRKGEVQVIDTQPANITMADLVKKRINYLRPDGLAQMKTPIGIAIDKEGTRYVTDTRRNELLMYDKDGNFLGTIGRKENIRPCGVAVDGQRLYVTDLSNHCVRIYQKASKELLFTVPKDPKDEKSKLHSPTNVAVDEQGRIYASDTGGFNVQVYDAQGHYVRSLGEQGLEPGRFARPKGVAVDRDGRVYVVDAATQVVQMFDKEGRLLMYFGEPSSSGPAGMYLPAGVAVDYENVGLFQQYAAPGYKLGHLIFVTNQAGKNKVSVYGFLHKS
jgi:DNA-binding beta-propeller fold protein YncE